MIKYVLEKVGYAVLTLFGVVSVVFFLFNILPGDPTRMMLDQREDSQQMEALKIKYGFDQPLEKQYLYYLNDLSPISFHSVNSDAFTTLKDDKYKVYGKIRLADTFVVLKNPYLRTSFQKGDKPVSDIITETLPNTAVLAFAAILIALFIGVILGVISALFKDTWLDRLIALISTVGMSVPSFFSAILFAWIFGFLLKPYTGLNMNGNLYEINDLTGESSLALKNLILPAIVLGIRPLGVVIQLMRNSLLEVLGQDYIRTARSKGLSELSIIRKHALRNSLNPVVTAVSGWFASMLAGAVFVEYIFNWNGLGKEIVSALNTLDLPVIMGSVLVVAFFFILINILVDLLYALLDPRIRLD
ncbi:MAG: ABC transporter permease [Flavobacteriaceae bacterium]